MSRIGRLPIEVPPEVEVAIEGRLVTVKGPKGVLEQQLPPEMEIVKEEDGTICVRRPSDAREHRALHGLTRTLVANMVEGVSKGFEKTLEIVGVGYRAASKDGGLDLALGFSHPVRIEAPEGISFEVPSNTKIVVKGIDKQQVGQVAANIRSIRKPNPYKGKGVRYSGEVVRRKAGKAGK
jgi:large subunit ribosomal protein L6